MRKDLYRRVICLTLGMSLLPAPSQGASDGEILDKVLRALNQRRQVLHHYSVLTTVQVRAQARAGAQPRANETRHYFGSSDEFKAEPWAGAADYPGVSVEEAVAVAGAAVSAAYGPFNRETCYPKSIPSNY